MESIILIASWSLATFVAGYTAMSIGNYIVRCCRGE